MPNPAGVSQCSSNTCGDINDPNNSELTKLDENMYQDNGARDTDGTCLGQVYIFNGKPSRCRPPGLTVGVLNDCCVSDKEIIQDDMGTMISVAEDTVSTLYDIGTISYYTYQLTTGATTFAEVTEGIGNSGAVMNSMGGVFEAISAGADLVSALTEGISAYCSALVASPAVIIGVVVAVVMKVLMGGGCDKTDIQTGQGVKSKQCHFIGDYCEKKLLGACYQRARGYCCFNSKMARIIQEQGRPQLQSFQPNGAWGGPDAPNCRGFTPDEFQALDFSRIDLSEYFEDVQKDLATKIDGSQQTIMQNIQNKFQATQK
jgi:conjugal transfer mating pair stabilization protein TraN